MLTRLDGLWIFFLIFLLLASLLGKLFMVSALSATSASPINIIPANPNSCESSPSTPSTMTSASTFSNASNLDNPTPKINGATSFEHTRPAKNIWAAASPNNFPAHDSSPARGINGHGNSPSDFPALAETRNSPPWNKSNNPSGGNTRSSSVNGRDESAAVPSGSGKKNKWVPIPAAEMQAALDQARPPRSHSHSRGSSRRNSPGELRRNRRLPEDSANAAPGARRKGLATPTFGGGGGGGSGSVSKPGTANPSPGPMSAVPPPSSTQQQQQSQAQQLLRRKAPRLSAPVSGLRPIPPLAAEERRENFGSFDSTEPESTDLDESGLDRLVKQYGRFGVAVGVPLGERNQRRTAARRPLSTANDIEEDWTGDGRWTFGLLGSFDRRAGLSRNNNAPGHGHGPGPATGSYMGPIHSPRPRGARGRGGFGGGMRGMRGMHRGGGQWRGSPANSDYAMLPAMPPMEQYPSPSMPWFNPYAYGPYAPPPPPMWNPYAPYGGMPPMPPPPPPAIMGGTAPPPVPITNMDSQGWIPVSTVTSFNRLRRLTLDVQLVREMMMLSALVELSADGEKARMAQGAWSTFVLPDAQDASVSASSQSVASEPTMGGTSPATSVDVDAGAGEGEGALRLVGMGEGEGV
ncbi:hypothetical protein FRC09_018532 [Ceratobasidium sp. 395]|nr:hypothetical protein FRC09_018532 [Ceratobasidium sp. 395]